MNIAEFMSAILVTLRKNSCTVVKRHFLFLLLSSLASPLVWAGQLRLYLQEFTPFTYTDNKNSTFHGILTDKVAEIMKRAGLTYQFNSTSLARGLHAIQNDEQACLFGFRRTPERESQYSWVGPLISDNWVLYGKKSQHPPIKTFEESKAYLVGSYKNAATGLQLAEQGYRINFASQDSDNPRLLTLGRIDFWIVSELHGLTLAQQQNLDQDIVKVLKYRHIDLYMLCHQKFDKAQIDLFNKINKDVDNDGTMDKLIRKYSSK